MVKLKLDTGFRIDTKACFRAQPSTVNKISFTDCRQGVTGHARRQSKCLKWIRRRLKSPFWYLFVVVITGFPATTAASTPKSSGCGDIFRAAFQQFLLINSHDSCLLCCDSIKCLRNYDFFRFSLRTRIGTPFKTAIAFDFLVNSSLGICSGS